MSDSISQLMAYSSGYLDGAITRARGVNWSHVGGVALVGSGAVALAALSLVQFYSPFVRGRRRRAATSTPFDAAYTVPSSVSHQFYSPSDFSFIDLSLGRVRYFLRGPPVTHATRVVVLVHGFSIAADIWKQQSDYLVAQGHTVLSFDNYGRGWSDAVDQVLDENIYVGQIAELLFALGITSPIDLVGVSMGGAIVASFAARYPHAVARLCMVCPAGLPIAAPPAMGNLMKLPLIGPAMFKAAIAHMQERGAGAQWEVKGSDEYHAWWQFARQNMDEHDGFIRTLYRTVVNYPMSNQRHNYDILAKQKDMKILILWGEKDGLTPYSNGAILHALLPGSQFVTIVGAKHNFLIERPQPANEILAAWLAGKPMPARIKTSIQETPEEASVAATPAVATS